MLPLHKKMKTFISDSVTDTVHIVHARLEGDNGKSQKHNNDGCNNVPVKK